MGNRPSSGAEGTHVAEILQSPRMEDEAKIFGDYTTLLDVGIIFRRDKFSTTRIIIVNAYPNVNLNFNLNPNPNLNRNLTLNVSTVACTCTVSAQWTFRNSGPSEWRASTVISSLATVKYDI